MAVLRASSTKGGEAGDQVDEPVAERDGLIRSGPYRAVLEKDKFDSGTFRSPVSLQIIHGVVFLGLNTRLRKFIA